MFCKFEISTNFLKHFDNSILANALLLFHAFSHESLSIEYWPFYCLLFFFLCDRSGQLHNSSLIKQMISPNRCGKILMIENHSAIDNRNGILVSRTQFSFNRGKRISIVEKWMLILNFFCLFIYLLHHAYIFAYKLSIIAQFAVCTRQRTYENEKFNWGNITHIRIIQSNWKLYYNDGIPLTAMHVLLVAGFCLLNEAIHLSIYFSWMNEKKTFTHGNFNEWSPIINAWMCFFFVLFTLEPSFIFTYSIFRWNFSCRSTNVE